MSHVSVRGHRYDDRYVALVCQHATAGLQAVQELMQSHDPAAALARPALHQDLMDAAVNGVTAARSGETSPRDLHNRWVDFLLARGWQAGPEDPAARTHPALVWWEKLPSPDRDRTRVFLGIVMSMTIDVAA